MTAVAREKSVIKGGMMLAFTVSAFSLFQFVFTLHFLMSLLCYITNHLTTGPSGNSRFCFPQMAMFPLAPPWETFRFSGNNLDCFPWHTLIKCLLLHVHVLYLIFFHVIFANKVTHTCIN